MWLTAGGWEAGCTVWAAPPNNTHPRPPCINRRGRQGWAALPELFLDTHTQNMHTLSLTCRGLFLIVCLWGGQMNVGRRELQHAPPVLGSRHWNQFPDSCCSTVSIWNRSRQVLYKARIKERNDIWWTSILQTRRQYNVMYTLTPTGSITLNLKCCDVIEETANKENCVCYVIFRVIYKSNELRLLECLFFITSVKKVKYSPALGLSVSRTTQKHSDRFFFFIKDGWQIGKRNHWLDFGMDEEWIRDSRIL